MDGGAIINFDVTPRGLVFVTVATVVAVFSAFGGVGMIIG
jgi:hypothetical protein